MPAKVAVITGASGGIGREAAIKLKTAGWQVAAIGRDRERTKALGQALNTPSYTADFADLREVSALAGQLEKDWPRIDALINNAGGMFPRGKKTVDGHETTFQVNHLAHFLLTRLLMDRLLKSQASVINTSSVAHRLLGFTYNPKRPEAAFFHSTHLAYGNAKLANILFTRELHRRYHSRGLSSAAVHPGAVATSFSHNTLSPMRLVYDTALHRLPFFKTAAQGADTLVRLAQGTPGMDWASGGYYSSFRQAEPSRMAKSDAAALSLWEESQKAVEGFL